MTMPASTKARFSGLFCAFVRHWMRLEWFGWRFYLTHLCGFTKALSLGDPGQLRWWLSIPSYGIAFWLWSDAVAYANAGFKHIAELMSENVLGAVFMLHAVGTHWRVYSLSRGIGWSSFFGVLGMLLYFGYPIFVWLDLDRLTGQGICMFGWGCVATFVTARIGNGEDRSGS